MSDTVRTLDRNNKDSQTEVESSRDNVRRGEDGQSLVEFALCLPPLFLLMTGIFAFGIAVANYITLTNATGSAAMALAVSRGNTLDPCATASSAVFAATPNFTQGNLVLKYTLDGNSESGTSCSSTSYTTGAPSYLVEGQSATVTVTYPCSLVIFRANNFPSCVLTAKASEIIQ